MVGNANGRELDIFVPWCQEIEALAKLRMFPALPC